MKKVSLPAIFSILAIFILAVTQFFIIRYAYQLKYGELEFTYKNVYEYAKPFFEVQWESADELAQTYLDNQSLIENDRISKTYIAELQSSFINSEFIESKIEEYFRKRGLLDEVTFSLVMKNTSLSIGNEDYVPVDEMQALMILGDIATSEKGNLVYRHIANSEYITVDFDLFIHFPDRTSLLISEMKWVIILSIVTFLLISFVAVSNLRNWQKQKQLSEIKDDLIDHISHELRTPITSINIASDSISNNGKELGLSRVIEISGMIKRQGSRLQQMIDNLLNTAFLDQNQVLNKEITVVDDFLADYLRNVKLLKAYPELSFNIDLGAKSARVMLDSFLFESMLNNLIDNAIKYNQNIPVINIQTTTTDDQYILSIADNGIGIAPAHMTSIFDKFQRYNKSSKGLGLGLYHVQKIIMLHGGAIETQSQPDRGTTFTISLPVYD